MPRWQDAIERPWLSGHLCVLHGIGDVQVRSDAGLEVESQP
jgi:hypothetical protein